MKINKYLAIIIFSLSIALAWNVEKNYCEYFQLDPCLTSFQWCDIRHGGCSLPPGAYPDKPASSMDIWPLLDPYMNYTIQWQTSKHSVPVTIRWDLHTGPRWETNVSRDTKIIFNPSEVLNAFPTTTSPTNSSAEAWYAASNEPTTIQLIQAGKDGDVSQPFFIGLGAYKMFLQQQQENEYNRWKEGVGLGVGLGVPVLLTLTGLVTWFTAKRVT
ncbi:hypothetical protein F5Y19DRAFT_480729 [Xylariaceae sp. FL1651]|nr:hypothetical protein F5Y19DRAFT_480729 [Xylariaceae sp. FL1651]